MRRWLVVIAFIVAVLVAVLVPAQTISDYRADHGWIVRVDGSARSSHIYDKGCYSPDGHTQLTDCIIWRTDDGGPFGVWPDPAISEGKLWWPLGQTSWLEASCAWASYAQSGNYSNQCSLTDGSAVLAVFDTRTLAMYGLAYSVGGAIRPVFPITYIPEVKPTWTPVTVPTAPIPTATSVPVRSPTPSGASPTSSPKSSDPTPQPCQFGSLCQSPGVTTITPASPTPSYARTTTASTSPTLTPSKSTSPTRSATPIGPSQSPVASPAPGTATPTALATLSPTSRVATASPTLTPSSTYPRATVVVGPRRTRTIVVGSRPPEATLPPRSTPTHAVSVTILADTLIPPTRTFSSSYATTATATPMGSSSPADGSKSASGYTPSGGSYFAFGALLAGLAIKFRAWLAQTYGRVLNWFRRRDG